MIHFIIVIIFLSLGACSNSSCGITSDMDAKALREYKIQEALRNCVD